jgi:hypothetical protein
MGGDTDTNAAISGVILGLKLRYSGLLKESQTRNNMEILLRADPSKGEFSPYGKQRLAAAPHTFSYVSFYIYVIQRRNVVRS